MKAILITLLLLSNSIFLFAGAESGDVTEIRFGRLKFKGKQWWLVPTSLNSNNKKLQQTYMVSLKKFIDNRISI